jgi:hypothetical protein
MALQTVSMILSATTTTLHRNWANALSAALTAIGLTKTADTGQIVLTGTTLAYPTVAQGLGQGVAAFTGYEIRQMVSAGRPTLYLKVRYGIYYNNFGTGANFYWPAVAIEVGTATDGAGNITSIDSNPSRWYVSSNGSMSGSLTASSGRPSAVAQNCYIASDGANYLTVMLGSNAPAFENKMVACFGIERTNTPGAATFTYNGNGIVFWQAMSGVVDNTQNVAGAAYMANATQARYILQDINLGLGYSGTNVPTQTAPYVYKPNPTTDCTIFPVTVGVGHGPLRSVFGYDQGALIENTQFAANVYNASRNFIGLTRVDGAFDPYDLAYPAVSID